MLLNIYKTHHIYSLLYNTSIRDIKHSPNYTAFGLPLTHQVTKWLPYHHHHASMDLHDPLLPPFSIVHLFLQVLLVTSRIGPELLYIGSIWLSCLCSSMWTGPLEYVKYELVSTSPAVSRMSGSSNLDCFRDGWEVAFKLLPCGVLPPGLVQYSLQHSRLVAVKLFLHPFS